MPMTITDAAALNVSLDHPRFSRSGSCRSAGLDVERLLR